MTESQSDFIKNDNFAQLLGVEIVSVEDNEATAKMKLKKEHLNSHNSVHGGVLFSIADIVFAVACNSESSAVAVQADIRFLAKPQGDELIARAYVISSSRKLANYQIDISDGFNHKVAQFSAIAYKL